MRESERKRGGRVLLTRPVMKLHDVSDAIIAAGSRRERMRDRSFLVTARSSSSNLNPFIFFAATSIRLQFEWHEGGTPTRSVPGKRCATPEREVGEARTQTLPPRDHFAVVAETG